MIFLTIFLVSLLVILSITVIMYVPLFFSDYCFSSLNRFEFATATTFAIVWFAFWLSLGIYIECNVKCFIQELRIIEENLMI